MQKNKKRNPQLLVKNNIPNQHGEEKLKTLRIVFSLWGLLSFKTCHRSFSSQNAVSLTSSHAAEPCCITMTQECPSPSRKSSQCNSSLGEGQAEERGGCSAEEWVRVQRGGGKQKGGRLPVVTAHPQANTGKSITCRIKQTGLCAR